MNGPRFVISAVATVFFLNLLGGNLYADEQSSETVRMNTRLFDLGVDPETLRRDDDFIPLNRIPWLDEILRSDPMLRGLVLQIRALNHPADHLWNFPGPGKQYVRDVTLPKNLAFDGYVTKSTSTQSLTHLLYLPTDDEPSFSASCAVDRPTRSQLSFCAIYSAYPPDPRIFLLARMYDPEKYDDLPKRIGVITQKMRQIARCLDVTEGAPGKSQDKAISKASWGCKF